MNDLVDRYLACWNETDSAVRRDLITKTWVADASYIDPLVNAQGHDAIDAAGDRLRCRVRQRRWTAGPGRRLPRQGAERRYHERLMIAFMISLVPP
ncbi:MAG TPA: hypothetical protein VGH54_20225 [Mycobacterium sp.]|jgi:transposase InsO family protein|uniref:hypothetical protein n=1 Tax=Mycobacterium sp. TaxID=1785 RepID=UPI002F3EBE69